MNKAIKLEDVFGKEYVEELKKELPKANEAMQYHFIQGMKIEIALYIMEHIPGSQYSLRDSKDILLRELGDCCQMIHTVCEGEPAAFHILGDKVYRVE